MKKNDLLIILGAIAFGILFYKQSAGINFLIFSLIYSMLNYVFNKNELKKSWHYAFTLHLFTAWNIFYLNTNLAIIAWVFSLIYLNIKTIHSKNSFIVALFFALSSPFVRFGERIAKLFQAKENEQSKSKKLLYTGAILVSFLIILLFFFLYQGANPLFKNFTKNIDLSWINFAFIMLCVSGWILLLGMLKPFTIARNISWDATKLVQKAIFKPIGPEIEVSNTLIFFKLISLIVFISLNVMLLLLNSLDIQNIFIYNKLPDGITLSDFVHFSVNSSITSIVLAIIIIVLIQQLGIKNRMLKILIYGWIFQSIVMLFHTIIRNSWYIKGYQLTYSRIGVYLFIMIAIIGLIYTAYSISKEKNYWFLMNINIETWIIVLVISSTFSWDRIITNYNLSEKKIDQIDIQYLNSLSENNLDLMVKFEKKHPDLFKYYSQKEQLYDRKKYFFKRMKKYNSWQSFSLGKQAILINFKVRRKMMP